MQEIANQWQDYCLMDAGNREKLERWGSFVLRRPDPQAIWPIENEDYQWHNAHAFYHRSSKGGGVWEYRQKIPETWTITYRSLTFKVAPTGFKHTGIFPEQAANWDWMSKMIKKDKRDLRILNLFAYTGGATMVCSQAGASEVVHVDAAKGMVHWAKENMVLSHLENNNIRFIVDDVLKFVAREKRRGHTYHGIIMDPPSFGRGPDGEMFKLEDQIVDLIKACQEILADDPLFFLVNAYTNGFSYTSLNNVLKQLFKDRRTQIVCGELGLPIERSQFILPCGIYGRVTFDENPL